MAHGDVCRSHPFPGNKGRVILCLDSDEQFATATAARTVAQWRGMTLPRVPRRGERVRVDNHEGTFIVVRIDKIDGFANVELWNDPHVALWDVPFGAMRLIRDSVGEAA